MKFKIGNKWVGDDQPAFVIAEIGSNFNGSLDKAKELVDLAIDAGADAVKFQSFIAEKIICREAFDHLSMSFQANWKKPVWDVYKAAEFPREWHQELMAYCKEKNVVFFSSPYDIEAVDLLDEIGCDCFKIGSGEISNVEFLEYVASKGKPIILACGATNMAEIEEAVTAIRKKGVQDLALLQCITNYPSPVEQANVRAMLTIQQAFQVIAGYSDHTLGDTVVCTAVALGAKIIEKHFTFDKTSEGPDHPHAMDVPEFTTMVKRIRETEACLGSYEKDVVDAEKDTTFLQRRSIFSAQDIPEGIELTEDMLAILRPQAGLLPKYKKDIIGLTTKKPLEKGMPLTWDVFK
ncbi:MAG TPA: N-acetylneuraminate synthase family protein [Candidatus Lokiarchaeia archaeon]|nr:N-acetylneuraminate synthase family protein [Candidatus Lokiarchaeia archaeon]